MRIISVRGRVLVARRELKKYLEEKYQLRPLDLTDAEKEKVERVFEVIRRELEAIGGLRA